MNKCEKIKNIIESKYNIISKFKNNDCSVIERLINKKLAKIILCQKNFT